MNKPPAFQFYPKDWLSSSRILLMRPEHEGAYIRLLCHDWENNGIPDNDDDLASLSRLGDAWNKGGSTVVKKCFIQHPDKPGFLTNERLQKERKKQYEWRIKSSEGGKKSATTRWGSKHNKRNKGGVTTVVSGCLPIGDNQSVTLLSSSSSASTPISPNGNWHPTHEQLRLGAMFGRRPTTRWHSKEIKAWKEITPIDESDMQLLEDYYGARIPEASDYRRHDLTTLLNNFAGELDRARNFKPAKPF